MQRIDENTFIDDTLVTCAEYQLFIDEMREQGKYYQPDHWVSYQFSKGKAREPILGLHIDDVKAFSEWLQKREKSEWIFRMPFMEEVKQFPITPNKVSSSLGYWTEENLFRKVFSSSGNLVEENRFQYEFIWIGAIPDNPRKIKDKCAFQLARDLTLVHDPVLAREFARDLTLALDRNVNGAHELYNALRLAYDMDLGEALAHYRALDRNLDLDHARIQALNRTLDHASKLPRDRYFVGNLNLGIYIDIFTLQERIAGRSPAFEGIRLVKERIR